MRSATRVIFWILIVVMYFLLKDLWNIQQEENSINLVEKVVKPRIFVTIITQYRVKSLSRLLKSLVDADYMGDTIDLVIQVDGHEENQQILDLVNEFVWKHGKVVVNQQKERVGLINNVMTSWNPLGNDEYAVMLEDDVSVAPAWYQFVKDCIYKYRYNGKLDHRLMGISLYNPRVIQTVHPAKKVNFTQLEGSKDVILFQTPCSWGHVYFPEHWRALQDWVKEGLDFPGVLIPGSQTNFWKGSWKKFAYEIMYAKGWTMLYPTIGSFSTNHMEKGQNLWKDPKENSGEVQLYNVELYKGKWKGKLSALNDLAVYDLFLKKREWDELVEIGEKWYTGILVFWIGGSVERNADRLGLQMGYALATDKTGDFTGYDAVVRVKERDVLGKDLAWTRVKYYPNSPFQKTIVLEGNVIGLNVSRVFERLRYYDMIQGRGFTAFRRGSRLEKYVKLWLGGKVDWKEYKILEWNE